MTVIYQHQFAALTLLQSQSYRPFSQWANIIFFFFRQGPSRRDNEQLVAHWFVSCIDSVNHPITMRYRRSDEEFCSAYKKIAAPQLLPRRLFPHFHSSFIKNRLALRWVMRDKEPGRRRRGECCIGKVLNRDTERRQASNYPNVWVRLECRMRKHFLIKFKFVPRDFLAKSSQVCS